MVNMNEKRKAALLKDRLLSLFDNILANLMIIGLGIAIPAIIGFFLKLEIQLILLIILIVGQIIGLILLSRIHRRLSTTKPDKNILVQGDKTTDIFLIDDFGLPHQIKDENTQQYFLDILGYKENEIPKISADRLKPIGESIISISKWRPPKTIEKEMSSIAQRSLWLSHKYIRKENGVKAISIDIRNDNDQVLLINSAKLGFSNSAPPLTISDISPKNRPGSLGLLECTLLFDSGTPNKALSPQETSRLDLFLKDNFSEEELSEIIGARFGFITMAGVFKDVNVSLFHEV
ncbi:MAG: hypothetical protein CVU39_21000 [Chloroflexi bacterium HGW-Chloroflexi-10]|nr:MAG: hypothetical protein CVU39_21000 [Chloroflexi bacterium HGW-Chloroflexi-10]